MFKKSRRTLSFLLVFLMSLSTLSLIAVAQNDFEGLNENKTYEEYLSDVFSRVTFDKDSLFVTFSPVDKEEAENKATNITLNYVGMSSLLEFSSFKHEVDEDSIKYETSDENVVVAYNGRILATGKGTATVTISYNDKIQIIHVTVKNEIDKKTMQKLESAYMSNKSVSSNSEERSDIIQRAIDMVYVTWTPTQALRQWHRENVSPKYFPANTLQFGIPYTQGTQCNESTFLNKLNNASDFYDVQVFTGFDDGLKRYGPKYGNDCSGFVSFAWNISRLTTYGFISRINDGTYRRLPDYYSLERGDAVVTEPHMFLIAINFPEPPSGSEYDEPYVVCYEQTPPQAALTFHTYSQLSSDGYIPFSKFK